MNKSDRMKQHTNKIDSFDAGLRFISSGTGLLRPLSIFLGWMIIALAPASGQITLSTTAPTPGASDAFNLPGNPSGVAYAAYDVDYNRSGGNSQYYSNAGPLPAQTFTTGSNALGYTLSSVTVGIATSTGSDGISNPFPASITLEVGSVSGGTFTPLYTGSASTPSSSNGYYGDFLTFTLPTSLTLQPNTTYAYVCFDTSTTGSGYFPLALDKYGDYAGGVAAGLSATLNGAVITPGTSIGTMVAGTGGASNLDAIFDVALSANTAVPPASGQITLSTTAPTPGASDAFNLPGNPSGVAYAAYDVDYNRSGGNSQYYSNAGPLPAQTFTTGSNALGYTLSSVTVGIATSTGSDGISNPFPASITLEVGSVSGGTFTPLYTGSASTPSSSNGYYGDFLTFTLPTSLTLQPNTTYAYVCFDTSTTGSGYFPLALDKYGDYAGGVAAGLSATLNGAVITPGTSIGTMVAGTGGASNLDAIFDVALSANTVASTHILYGNMSGYNNDGGGTTQLLSNSTSAGGKEIGFMTGTNTCTLTDVMLRLIIPTGNPNPPAVYLYTGGAIGTTPTNSTLVTQFINPSFAGANGSVAAYTFVPPNPVALAPNTVYWIVVDATTYAANIGWASGNPNIMPTGIDGVSCGIIYGSLLSGGGPNTWTTQSTTANWFQVDGYQSPAFGNIDLYNNDAGVATNMPSNAGGEEIGFTTGPNGYTMTDAVIRLNVLSPAANPPAVYLYTGGTTGASPTAPNQLVTQLKNPAFTAGVQNYTFTTPSPVLLQPNTSYWIAVVSTGAGQPNIEWISGNPNISYNGSDEVSYSLLYGSTGAGPTGWTSASTTYNWLQVDGYPTLWRIGLANNSSTEFGSSGSEKVPANYTIPTNWATMTNWSSSGWPDSYAETGTVSGSSAWASNINFTLTIVPPGGAIFTIQSEDASPFVTQLAISSNGTPCGIIQMVGTHNYGNNYYNDFYIRPYQIYIPKEFLTTGSNTLQISRLAMTYSGSFNEQSFKIDYMQLDGLTSPPDDPIHGKYTNMGIDDGDGYYLSIATAGSAEYHAGGMTYAADGVHSSEQLLQEWMGVAYSNNPAGAGFWSNNAWEQDYTTMGNFLGILKNLNMTIYATCLGGGGSGNSPVTTALSTTGNPESPYVYNTANGTETYEYLSGGDEGVLNNFESWWGNKIQFYYLCNEPCQSFSAVDYNYAMSAATYAKSIFPSTLKVMAPGYAYGGGYGYPVNWDGGDGHGDSDAAAWNGIKNRAALDAICDTYGGHSWGTTYCNDAGSLIETINSDGTGLIGSSTQPPALTAATIDGEWAKPFFCTECGSQDNSEWGNWGTYEYTIFMDINLRANLGFADYFCVADAFNNGPYNFLDGNDWDSNNWSAHPAGGYLPLTATTMAAAGQTSITLTNGAEAVVGAALSGTGIASGTTVTRITGNVVTLNNALTGSGVAANEIINVDWYGVPMEAGFISPTLSASGTTTSSTALTLSASATFQVGSIIQGVGIPNPTTVTAISGSTVTLSQAASVNNGAGLIIYDVVPHEPVITKVQVIRRLALAYATHGQPLSYCYGTTTANTWPLQNTAPSSPLVYFRAVNTATLAPLPANGATSNKLLLSFVNFDENTSGNSGTHTITVSVVMPKANYTYTGVRYGAGNTLALSRSIIGSGTLTTDSHGVLNVSETLPCGESVEYILNP